MDHLPPCFKPRADVVENLERIRDGLSVDFHTVAPLASVGMIRIVMQPTSRSGYELTSLGEEALERV